MRYCFLLATVITICISSPASAQWTEIGQLEDERMNMIVLEGPEENTLTLMGGTSTPPTGSAIYHTEAYTLDLISGELVQAGTLTHPIGSGTVVNYSGRLYVVGTYELGFGSKRAYRLGDDYSLTDAGENPSPAAFPAIGSRDSLVYLIGGERAEDGPFTNSSSGVMVYNIATESWSKCTDFPTSIAYSGAAMSHDSLFVVGGSVSKDPGEIFSDKFYLGTITNDSTISWSQLPNLPIAVTGGKCALISSDLFFFGGYSANGLLGQVWKYSFQSGVWTQEISAPIGLAQTSNFFALGGVLYVAGGISSKSILSYEAKTGSISVSQLLPQVGSVTLSECCLSIKSHSDKMGSLSVYNIKGEIEFSASIEPQSQLSINREELASGVHIIEFKSNGKRWIQRILV